MIELLKTDCQIGWWNDHREYTNEFIKSYNNTIKEIRKLRKKFKKFKEKESQADYQIELIEKMKETLDKIIDISKECEERLNGDF